MFIDAGIATVVVGVGTRRNALGDDGWDALAATAAAIAGDVRVRAVIIRGAGDDFCAGSDLRAWERASPEAVDRTFVRMERALRGVEAIAVPVLAAVTGVAVGAGCQLALACDLRVAAEDARIGMPIARLAILPSVSFALRLAAVGGPGLARDLLFTGRLMSGVEAGRRGVVDRVVPAAHVDDVVMALAAQIARQPRVAVVAAKAAVATALAPLTGPAQIEPDTIVDEAGFRAALRAFTARRLT